VDADSFQVRDPETGVVYRSLVGKPEYTPPELQGCSFADVDRQPEHDAFALAVLIFRLLMEGFHPFDGVYRGRGEPPELGARIRNGYFPYARGRTGMEPSPLAPPFEMLHPDLQALFVRCFAEGHRNRRVRPRVEDWLKALEGAEDALQQCGRNEQHYYWGHLAGCPWCARQQALGGRDPFPSRASVSSGQHLGVSGRQQPLPSASATTPASTPVRAPTPKPRRPQQPSSPNTPAPTPVRTPTLPPMPTQTRAFRRVYRALVWSVLAILLIGLGIINLFGRQEQVVSTPAESTDTPIDIQLVRTLKGHTAEVRSVSFSPDGRLLASGSEDGTIKLWRVSDGSLVRTLTGHAREVDSVSFSPDGRLLASGSGDNTIKLWRVSDGVLVRTLHPDSVYSVSFSPDGRLLASGGWQGIKLWRVADGSLVRTLEGHTGWVRSVSFSPDGSLLASGSEDKTIKLWRVADGSLVRTLTGHTQYVDSVSFSPDGRLLASGSADYTIKLWRVSDGVLVRTLHPNSVCVSFSPDGRLLALGGWQGIKLWRVADGSEVRTLTGHTDWVNSVSFSPDGRLLASGSGDSTIKLWRVADGALR
jgi:WD40 repeat protein